ncbi:MAG: methylmalonyl-CoA mutase family protein, partial [Desulfobacterales bacterium]|nr:methylmalonyl-CoA mutase family protein [Desulfobacterales bacterium]
ESTTRRALTTSPRWYWHERADPTAAGESSAHAAEWPGGVAVPCETDQRPSAMGGAVAAIENGYLQREIARSAHERQKRIEEGRDLIVGVNCFTGEQELEVTTTRLVPHPYDPQKRERAEEEQVASVKEVKRSRDNREVARLLGELKEAAKKEDENLIPKFIECAKAYVTEQEMCDVLREVFGEYKPAAI